MVLYIEVLFVFKHNVEIAQIIAKGGNRAIISTKLKKDFHFYPTVFQNSIKLMRK